MNTAFYLLGVLVLGLSSFASAKEIKEEFRCAKSSKTFNLNYPDIGIKQVQFVNGNQVLLRSAVEGKDLEFSCDSGEKNQKLNSKWTGVRRQKKFAGWETWFAPAMAAKAFSKEPLVFGDDEEIPMRTKITAFISESSKEKEMNSSLTIGDRLNPEQPSVRAYCNLNGSLSLSIVTKDRKETPLFQSFAPDNSFAGMYPAVPSIPNGPNPVPGVHQPACQATTYDLDLATRTIDKVEAQGQAAPINRQGPNEGRAR